MSVDESGTATAAYPNVFALAGFFRGNLIFWIGSYASKP